MARRGSAVYTAIAFHFALVTPIIDLTLDQEGNTYNCFVQERRWDGDGDRVGIGMGMRTGTIGRREGRNRRKRR